LTETQNDDVQQDIMSKTKTVRMAHDDAFIVEQAVRELAAELQMEIKVSELLKELTHYVPEAKEKLKAKIESTSSK
jgi:transcription termination factor NusB